MTDKPYITDAKKAIQDSKDAGVAADRMEEPITDPDVETVVLLKKDATLEDIIKAVNNIAVRQSAIIQAMRATNQVVRSKLKAFYHWHLSTAQILLAEIDSLRARVAKLSKNR